MTNYAQEGLNLLAAGKLRQPGNVKGRSWGWPPLRADCLNVEDFEWPLNRTTNEPVADHAAFHLAYEYAVNECRSSVPEEWAVSFTITKDGAKFGTFYGNEWGWEYV